MFLLQVFKNESVSKMQNLFNVQVRILCISLFLSLSLLILISN